MKFRHYTFIALAMLSTASLAQNRRPAKKTAATAKTVKTAKTTHTVTTMSPEAKALFEDMLPNTQRLFVIDSTIVDVDRVLSSIPLPEAYGKYVDYDQLFNTATGSKSVVFVNGFGNRCYYTEVGTDNISRLYMRDRLGDKWSKPVAIREINKQFTDISSPYMASDGQTLYFAGVSNSDGLGKRDIYMAKYDADEGHFMQAENIGLPFNSADDDFAYVIADADGMAWFATTRRQPHGKACIYAFVPASQRQNYDADALGRKELLDYAELASIHATWPSTAKRDEAMKRLNSLRSKASVSAQGMGSINFVVNDNTTYTSLAQFRSDDTRKAFMAIARQQKELDNATAKLDALRTRYHYAPANGKEAIAKQIVQLEQREAELRSTISQSQRELRRKEQLLVKK